MRVSETLSNNDYVSRIRELEAHGAAYFTIKVLNHNSGYDISFVFPEASAETPDLFPSTDT